NLDKPLTNGEKVDVTAKDPAGNVSDKAEVTAPDTTAPEAPHIDTFDGTTLIGTAEPNATITVKDKDGNVLVLGQADEKGKFQIIISPSLADGTEVKVTAKDQAGNESIPTTVIADNNADTTPPDAPTDVEVSPYGFNILGKAEAGSIVDVRDKDGNLLGSGITNENGDFYIEFETQLDKNSTVYVTATDAAGNISQPTEALVPNWGGGGNNGGQIDVIPPDVPTDLEFNEDGSTITGKAEPDSIIEIKDKMVIFLVQV
uniref:Ig-like domain-containing protein n=1 Tax=Acinetobacter sp. CFCC 10889 TaxID=1775557 RepID=UPI001D17EB45